MTGAAIATLSIPRRRRRGFSVRQLREKKERRSSRQRRNVILPGQYYDAESGLLHNSFRTYDPNIGGYLQADPTGFKGGISLYAYANRSPLSHSDPMGLWTCDPTDSRCTDFKNTLQSAQEASASGNLQPYQQATLANIVHAYGAEGVPNVKIEFGRLPPGIDGQTGKNKDTRCETITIDDKKLVGPLDHDAGWAETVVHEGQHLSDDFAGDVNNAPPVSVYDTEVNAYTAEVYYDQATQFTNLSGYGKLWTMNGGIDYDVIQFRAHKSAGYAQ